MTFLPTFGVEAGVDFSFRIAFRESWGLVNLLQIAGRAASAGLLIEDFRSQMDNNRKCSDCRFQMPNRKS